jgi:Iguana/Dzip1-like DAZ-interacting protein N-terminal
LRIVLRCTVHLVSTRAWRQPAQVRDTDLDALERVVSIVAFGDVEAEGPPGAVADVSLRRLLRLSQLANEYLLHVQDHLATRHGASKVRSSAMHAVVYI